MRLSLAWIGTAAATAALVAAAPAAAAQTEVKLRVDPTPDWQIQVSPDAVLSGDWVESANAYRLDSARLLFVPAAMGDDFWVVPTDGSDPQLVGRSGDGPGEYRYITAAVPHETGIHVFDFMSLRITVLDHSFEVVRTTKQPFYRTTASTPVVLQDSTYVVNGSLSLRPEAEEPVLHHFSASGDVVGSFDLSPLSGGANYRTLRADPDGSLWSAHRNQYRIDRWDVASGELHASLIREADWFVPHSGGEGGAPHPRTPPPPTLVDMELDADGRLWTQISVASDRWEEAFRPTGPDDHPEFGDFMLVDGDIAYETVVEVIDPATGCILASRTLEEDPGVFVGPGWGAGYADELNLTGQLWRLELQPLANGDGQPCA